MSKKKATMTLKDFHGGSIPSDLPLPSAPGVTVRPVDRGGFDRQMSWGSNSVGRSDHRLRPASAGSARNLDEKAPFLSNNSNIGRNFDEDERKPLDAASGPRRTVSDDNPRAQPNRMLEPKIDARVGSRAASISVSQISSGSSGSSYAGRVNEVHNARLNNQSFSGNRSYGSNYPVMGGNSGQAVGGSYPNAWGIRKEPASMKEPVSAPWSAPDAATKLAHASPLEKISSGRWNSKQHVHALKDAEVESEYNGNKKTYNRLEVQHGGGSDYSDVALMMHAERSLSVGDGIRGGGKDIPSFERPRSTSLLECHDRNMSFSGKSGGTEFQPISPSEASERPKLKLLPRSKPLENLESPVDYKQVYEQTSDPPPRVEDSYVVHEPKNPVQSGVGGPVVGDRGPERPKLNLKPRSQPIEHQPRSQQFEGNGPVKRGTVFGGARPREVVLKERGVEDDGRSHDSQSPLRVKEGAPKADTFTHVVDQRISKQSDNRRDQQLDGERSDPQRRNRQSEIWRSNNRDIEKNRNQPQKQQQQVQQDRAPSPETWRKPVEHDAPPVRFGKAASAVELAQAFSKSVSDPTVADRFSGSRGISNRSQVRFSRLMGPTPRPQINGY